MGDTFICYNPVINNICNDILPCGVTVTRKTLNLVASGSNPDGAAKKERDETFRQKVYE